MGMGGGVFVHQAALPGLHRGMHQGVQFRELRGVVEYECGELAAVDCSRGGAVRIQDGGAKFADGAIVGFATRRQYLMAELVGADQQAAQIRQLAADEVNRTAAWAGHIIELVRNELSEQDLEQLRALLAGGEVGEEDAPIKGAQDDPPDFLGKPRTGGTMVGDTFPAGLRRRLDAAAGTTSARGGFDARFPSARKIGRDDMIGVR